jgi:hypothetical protein
MASIVDGRANVNVGADEVIGRVLVDECRWEY